MTTTSYIAATSAEATSLTLPSHQAGDTIVIVAARVGNTTPPTMPSGWVSFVSRSNNGIGSVVAYKIAASAGETSGTWTNATHMAAATYRNDTNYLLMGAVGQNGNFSTAINYAALTMRATSWLVGIVILATNSTTGDTAPSGMTQRLDLIGASSGEVAIADTNSTVSAWSSTNSTSGSNVNYHTHLIELFDTGIAKTSVSLNPFTSLFGRP